MHIESVTAKAFGPLRDETLRLQPGLNVIVGRNESAKSTWHAAIYAAICGRSRRRGPLSREDREFAEQYRPWNGEVWHVQARLRLDDSRHIQIHHELNQAVDCAAMDLDLGRDVSNEIVHDGSPDASRWLGMNRSVFAATACVRQSEILAVLHSAGGLQQQLEAAATHAGTSDPTASQAIALLEAFKSEHVGLDRSNSTKPLRRARIALEAARGALQEAEQKHTEYMTLVSAATDLQAEADRLGSQHRLADEKAQSLRELREQVTAAEAAQATADHLQDALDKANEDLAALQSRLDRAIELDHALDGREPAGNHVAEQLVAQVAEALANWNSRPRPVELHGPDAATLQQQLEALPPSPSGDLSPDPSVEAAAGALQSADVLARSTLGDRPAPPAEPDPTLRAASAVGSTSLRNWAARLDSIEEVAPEDLQGAREQETAAARALAQAEEAAAKADKEFEVALQVNRPAAGERRTSAAVLGGAAVAVLAGLAAVVLLLMGNPAAGGGLAAVAGLAATGAVVAHLRAGGATSETTTQAPTAQLRERKDSAHRILLQAQRELLEAQSQVKTLESDSRDARTAREELEARCAANAVPGDAHSLRVLAEQVDKRTQAEQAFKHWADRQERDQDAVTRAEDALRRALQARGVEGSDVRAAHREYREACTMRSDQARESAKRPALEQALKARERDERQVEEALATTKTSLRALAQVAAHTGVEVGEVTEDNATDIVAALQRWQQQREAETRQLDAQRDMWSDLQAQLNGLTLSELNDQTEAKRTSASTLQGKHDTAKAHAEHCWKGLQQRAEELTGGLPTDRADIPGRLTGLLETANSELTALTEQLEVARKEANEAQGGRNKAAESLPSVPEAEEWLDACEAELQRVQKLASTLDVARRHLLDAQETVHRNIAPTLQRTLVEWLPGITENRYTDAAVDPETLEVTVRAGSDWVPARRLSFGTAEQIYLLLRVALVTHIANPETSCPMLLDDVTVQADEIRTRALLETLATLATSRQMILFAQEPLVEQWARERIAAGRDINLITLEQIPIE